jgi:Ca2+-binding EF-hand superfamily protein
MKIMEKLRTASFKQIFKWLDSDNDGLISANKINITQLSPELLEILGPLFIELEELQQALDEEEFVDALGRLYESIS